MVKKKHEPEMFQSALIFDDTMDMCVLNKLIEFNNVQSNAHKHKLQQ